MYIFMEDYFKLGIVIPYYKTGRIRETLMKELVENLKAQLESLDLYTRVKICIYEDGTNSTWLKNIVHCNFKVIQGDENKGISYARNRCIDYLLDDGCNYIVMIDSDDYIDYDYIFNIYNEWQNIPRLYYFTDFEILDKIKERVGLKERITGIVLHKSLLENARFNEETRYAEDVEFNDNYLRDKLTEPYYIDTVYHYNFGIDKKCLSYQAQLERGDRLND